MKTQVYPYEGGIAVLDNPRETTLNEGEYRVVRTTVSFSDPAIPAEPCLVLYRGMQRLCRVHRDPFINRVVVNGFHQRQAFVTETVELIGNMMSAFDGWADMMPLNSEHVIVRSGT